MYSTATVFDASGTAKVLGTLLASGGEGQVYPLADRAEILVKCYHPEVLQKRGNDLAAKTQAMIALKGHFAKEAVSWPLLSVFDQQRQWVGYAMRRANGVSMLRMTHPKIYAKSFPNLNRQDIVAYLLSLIDAVQLLHARNVHVGDYNFNNVLCTPGSNRITLIDCDSYQLECNGQIYPCPVGSPDMTPIEHHGKDFKNVLRTESSECFSIALVLFKCLMLGRHPYDIVGGEDPVSNLRAGRFAYGRGNSGIPQGPWYNIWSHMPHRLKEMFIATFTEGAGDTSQRPALAQWGQALQVYQNEMHKGWHESDLMPIQPKSKNYRGVRSVMSV